MKLTEALFCLPEEKALKVITEQKVYTKQELINEVKYDGYTNFDLTFTLDDQWIITQNEKPFAFAL